MLTVLTVDTQTSFVNMKALAQHSLSIKIEDHLQMLYKNTKQCYFIYDKAYRKANKNNNLA